MHSPASQANALRIDSCSLEWLPAPRPEPLVRGYPALLMGLGFLGLMSLGWSTLSLLLARCLDQPRRQRLGRQVITRGFRLYLRFLSRMGFVHLDLSALEPLPPNDWSCILAPNHPGLLDAVILLAVFPNIGCILKADILDNLFFGAGARLAGYIRNDQRQEMIRASIRELKSGGRLLLFPEGTRTTCPPVNRFKEGPALIARKAEVPLQTILIEYDAPFLGKDWPLFKVPKLPIHVRLRLGQRFDATGTTRETTHRMEAYFLKTLRQAGPLAEPSL